MRASDKICTFNAHHVKHLLREVYYYGNLYCKRFSTSFVFV